MAFFSIKKWFHAHCKGASGRGGATASKENFAVLSNRFRMFLTAWNRFQEVETQVEYTLCCDHPFGLYRVRALCTDTALQVYQCIRQLKSLNPKPCPELLARFGVLQKEVSSLVYEPECCIAGPMVLPLPSLELAKPPLLAAPGTEHLVTLPDDLAQLVPPGFVITWAGCHRLLGATSLQEEINRRIQAEGGLRPKRIIRLCDGVYNLMMDTPLPAELTGAITGALEELRASAANRSMTAPRLLFMGRLWPAESEEESDGLLIWGPPVDLNASNDAILHAVHVTLARMECPQAMIYRRARGLTEAGTGVSITCLAVEDGCRGGVAHTANPLQPTGSLVHIYASGGLPENLEYSVGPVDVFYVSPKRPWQVRGRHLKEDGSDSVLSDNLASDIACLSVRLASLRGKPQTVIWLVDPQGKLHLVFFNDLLLRSRKARTQANKDLFAADTPDGIGKGAGEQPLEPVSSEDRDVLPDEDSMMPAEADDSVEDLPVPLLTGGAPANPGIAAGHPVIARSWEDIRSIPPHAVLVVERDEYLWAAIIDRVSAIVSEDGLLGSRLASLCREFGIPAVFGLHGAMEKLAGQEWVTVSAGNGCVYPGLQNVLADRSSPPIDFMPGSPLYRMFQGAARRILPLTLETESLDFTAANCKTYHDIARYCHVKALDAMFTLGSGRSQAQERVRQLKDEVVKQFWVINLSDGFKGPQKGPLVDIKDVTSMPMQALWHGMNVCPWEGPPPVDGKGFLSVLFEATANPHLDPAAQTEYFTEKNYFLVSRDYVSMHSRFGFHFISVESRMGMRKAENYLSFQLRGGAADIERRVLRVNFVGDILWEFGFQPDIRSDELTARLEGMTREEGKGLLAVAGYLTIHTRQLDMIMQDREQVARRRKLILEQCRKLYTGLM